MVGMTILRFNYVDIVLESNHMQWLAELNVLQQFLCAKNDEICILVDECTYLSYILNILEYLYVCE